MNIDKHVRSINETKCQDVLANLLTRIMNPAFGSLPSKEVDLLVLDALIELGYVASRPGLYELVTKLRVTRPKARNLIYDRELRTMNESDLDHLIKEELKSPLIQKQGDLFLLEIENPLLIDHLRSRLKTLGHATDGSFSPSLVKLNIEALAALIEHYLTEAQRIAVKRVLVKAGAPDSSFQGVLKSTVRAIAKKIAQDSGEAMVENVSEYMGPVIDGTISKITDFASDLFD